MKNLILTIFCLVSFQSASALIGGDHAGNGGDLCELRFKNIKNDIASWIVKGGSAGLSLSAEIPLSQYNSQMLTHIRQARFSCVTEKVFVGTAEKTCKNFFDHMGDAKIICNLKRFTESESSSQYILVHHEYAGLSGFESNADEESNYPISNQISGYLEDETTKKLVIKPPISNQCHLSSSDLEKELMSAIKRNELACIKALAPRLNLNKRMATGAILPGTNWGDQMSPLSYSAQLGQAHTIQILIDAGAYIHYDDPYGFAIGHAALMHQAESIKVLVKNGAFLNFNTCFASNRPRSCDSPLGYALLGFGRPKKNTALYTIETLLKLGANPNNLTKEQTPLAYATVDFDFVDLLIKYNADPNLGNSQGSSALFFCYTGACVDKLVSVGADVNKLNYEGQSPLDTTIFPEVKKALIKYGAKPGHPKP